MTSRLQKPCSPEGGDLPVPVAITMQAQTGVFERCCTRSGRVELATPAP
eukprot:CAMPEP_0182493920 /NCGR_PEP_ID=MMETSP1321-20130603/2821_1 /TAXON_ID=91990 /ORGANISM="Bolidomonas sp., Strain RCC1657" /LENGTH=48 /DNA_ID= /DNA_START= /DNA_END= /DNA_ORIENTATION=